MSNSSLISYTKLSPNHSGKRKNFIDIITPHCMAGNMTVEGCGEWFSKPATQASSNYGIDSRGKIGLYVDEANRSWCSSSSANDNRAVTIEVANTEAKDPWPISDAAYRSLVNLCVDICRRNGKKKLLWFSDKNKTLAYKPASDEMLITVHRWYANKACPGDYIYSRLGQIAAEVTAALGGAAATPAKPTANESAAFSPYLVRVSIKDLYIRAGAGTNTAKKGFIAPGVYTIVEVKAGKGSTAGWGRLKSGAGWISLDFATKV